MSASQDKGMERRAWRLRLWVFLALGALLLLAIGMSVALGPVNIPLEQTVAILLQPVGWGQGEVSPAHVQIVQNLRLPRALAALFVGWVLAVSGTVMQGVFQNPLASPYLLGTASGSSAGAALVLVLGWGETFGRLALPLGAFLGGALAVGLVYRLAQWRVGRDRSTTLILVGVALGALFSAITTFLISLSGEQMRTIVFWIMGSLGRSQWTYLEWLIPLTLLGTLSLLPYLRRLNALALGETGARHLGLDPRAMRRTLLTTVTLMTAAAVAVAGTIGFVGLITPHALRLVLGPDHRLLLPASALGGALFLLISDTIARTAWAPLELPVGVLTAMVGAPFFLLLLLRRQVGGMQ